MAPKNGPPDRWMEYKPMGEQISGTRFICMKVPLKADLSRYMDESEKFSCQTAMDMAAAKGHKLGLVIDLSFTRRYYDPVKFEDKNVQYQKIFMPGHVLPAKAIINSFRDAVAKFEHENQDNENLIAVHCTHGLNRTGYMICRYLIDKKNFQPQDAIDAFEKARGYKIERPVYRNDLLGKPSYSSPQKNTQRSHPSSKNNRDHKQSPEKYPPRNSHQLYDNRGQFQTKWDSHGPVASQNPYSSHGTRDGYHSERGNSNKNAGILGEYNPFQSHQPSYYKLPGSKYGPERFFGNNHYSQYSNRDFIQSAHYQNGGYYHGAGYAGESNYSRSVRHSPHASRGPYSRDFLPHIPPTYRGRSPRRDNY